MNEQFVNAYEAWTLYDSLVIASNVDTLFKGAGYFTSYAAMSNAAQIPFFNVRNRSVGLPYNNFDSANKLPFVFHCKSIGVAFEPPSVSFGSVGATPSYSDGFFANELPKHCGFILKVSQDEKLVQTCTLMPPGQGVAGWSSGWGQTGPDPAMSIQNVVMGTPQLNNRWQWDVSLQMPREVNIEGLLILSKYARDVLTKMAGPGIYQNDYTSTSGNYPAAAQIRVSMIGMREVQQRNQLHFV